MFRGPLEEMMRRRAPQFPQVQEPQGPVVPQGPDTSEIERWYAELTKPPSLMEQIGAGIQVPNTPMRSRKGRVARMGLRGLVSGFKSATLRDRGGRGGAIRQTMSGGRAGNSNPDYEAARVDSQRALAEARRARAEEIGEPDDVDPLLGERRGALEALAGARNASAEATRRRAAAYEKRMGRAPAGGGGRGGGGGGSSLTQERMLLDRKRIAERERLRGVITNMYGETQGQYAKPEAIAALSRAWARVEGDYRRRIEDLAAKHGMGAAGDYGEDEDELY